ncbi:MAG TPA: hypothetical protein VGC75_03520 [Candidatus Nitrosocosmicus sp.]
MLMYYPKDDSFKPFRIDVEYWDQGPVFVNNELGLAVHIDENVDVCERIEQELKLSWQKIIEEYDESKLIFQKLKKVHKNLLELKKL